MEDKPVQNALKRPQDHQQKNKRSTCGGWLGLADGGGVPRLHHPGGICEDLLSRALGGRRRDAGHPRWMQLDRDTSITTAIDLRRTLSAPDGGADAIIKPAYP